MAAAADNPVYGQRVSPRRRLISLVLALAANALLLLLLFTMAPKPDPRPAQSDPTTVTLLPDTPAPQANAEEQSQAKASAAPRRRTEVRERKPPAPTPKTPTADTPPPPLNMIQLDRKSYAATDIAGLPAAGPSAGAADAGQGPAGDARPAGGRAPNGEPLYNAEWYREPTDAELAGYLPRGLRGGWGEVACRTVSGFRVEDCVELGQAPAGSGLSRAVRQAAWQFRVRAPRIGGKPMLGTWVRIRIDYSERKGD